LPRQPLGDPVTPPPTISASHFQIFGYFDAVAAPRAQPMGSGRRAGRLARYRRIQRWKWGLRLAKLIDVVGAFSSTAGDL
jgi:hypothetical protein